ncbi:golgin subfamily A member 4-like isoform X2 [Penaeus japonicus]|nr:golgin subfamily A member 4-like isoform X2 [Penaeus japonicus]XP_042882114.1 golgin subfamily A member 4-like isoform X2 [Penaeus japonicus]XP_042882115.1 golgin subfamily A member 4-like isoform X2 [Penaeus japonicus]XP_042882116.1 golgin subfamily A member 4-like isoform X2 [Penaeus japonicus]XP_042882117.1 golgin subfamily A member 4-like isoform X2 [Penaeus japonicus]
MSRDRRIRHYQRFLKTLKKPESNRCSCTTHLHPRPWVPPPCRTTQPLQEDTSLQNRRSRSNPELMTNTTNLFEGQPQPDWESDEESRPSQRHLRKLYREARVLKDALNHVRQGNQLSKDTSHIVKKWSKKRDPEHPPRREGPIEEKGQKPTTESQSEMLEALNRSMSEAQQEEEALRQELQDLRRMAKGSSAMEEENKKLKRKIHQLHRRLRRQEKVPRASHESLGADRELGSRDEFLILSLKKKYEDLLQYVLKVEAENQKLKSLTGLSGEGDGMLRDSDREDAQFGPHVVARLHHELEALREEVARKDGHIVEYEQRLQAMEALKEENITLHKTLRDVYSTSLKPSDERPITAAVEEEWMRRLAETREMYEQVVQGYKEKFEEMRENMIRSEEVHARRTRELENEVLSLKRDALIADSHKGNQKVNSKSSEGGESSGVAYDEDEAAREHRSQGIQSTEEPKVSSTENEGEAVSGKSVEHHQHDGSDADKHMSSKASKGQDTHKLSTKTSGPEKNSESDDIPYSDEMKGDNREKTQQKKVPGETSKEECHSCVAHGQWTETQKYVDTLNALVQRMEKVNPGGEGADTLSVIREAITSCLQEWRDSFQQQQQQPQQERDSPGLRREYEDLQKRMRSRQKKLESQQKQVKELESQNVKLTHRCSRLESQIKDLQSGEKFGLLQDLPQTLHDTEQKLGEAQIALQNAEAERQLLQDQVLQLGEKLNKKESKLKNEREQNSQKEKETSETKEKLGAARRQAEEMSREAGRLQDQLATKDALLERTSAQLEERIRECAGLSSQVERLRQERSQDWEKIQSQITERDSVTNKQYVDAQAQVARYQAQLSAMRSEKEQAEKSFRQHIRKLEEQLDHLQLRNSTLQRQLSTITTTYHNMFSSVDLHPPSSPGLGGTPGLKDP